jgi:hypothetical protein
MTPTPTIPESIIPTLSEVVSRVARRQAFSAEEAQCAGGELVKFLRLCADSTVSLAPSEVVDDLWHEFILHTRDYAHFCANVLGTFVHHVPSATHDPTRYQRTLERMNARFGNPDKRFWPASGGDCSDCGSDCSN